MYVSVETRRAPFLGRMLFRSMLFVLRVFLTFSCHFIWVKEFLSHVLVCYSAFACQYLKKLLRDDLLRVNPTRLFLYYRQELSYRRDSARRLGHSQSRDKERTD